MPNPPEFLIVDNNRDNRFLLTKTLFRKYPGAKIHECEDADCAMGVLKTGNLSAAIVHRAADMEGITLIQAIRRESPKLPILSVSGFDRKEQAFAAGANGFLHYDAWLSLGRVVDEMLRTGQTENPFQALAIDETTRARALE
jgi:CheY-like chemotaxis protein